MDFIFILLKFKIKTNRITHHRYLEEFKLVPSSSPQPSQSVNVSRFFPDTYTFKRFMLNYLNQ